MRVFVHLLLSANFEARDFEQITIQRGQVLTSYPKLAEALGLSVQSVRTAIKHLKDTGEITIQTYSKFSVVSVNNYDLYQKSAGKVAGFPPEKSPEISGEFDDDDLELAGKLTVNQQAANRQLTRSQQQYKKDKKDKKDKKESISLSLSDAEQVENLSTSQQSFNSPTFEEVQTYAETEHICTDTRRFYRYYSEHGWKTKSGQPITNWKATLKYWECQDQQYIADREKKKREKENIFVSENAEAYESLIYNMWDLPMKKEE